MGDLTLAQLGDLANRSAWRIKSREERFQDFADLRKGEVTETQQRTRVRKMTKPAFLAMAIFVSTIGTSLCFAQTVTGSLTPGWDGQRLNLDSNGSKTKDVSVPPKQEIDVFAPVSTIYKSGKSAKVPFQWINGEIVVTATLDGHSKLTFIVDTGVVKSAVDRKAVEDYLAPRNSIAHPFFGLGKEDMWGKRSSDCSLAMEGITINPVSLLLVSGQTFVDRSGIPINGYIGYDILKNYIIKLDYPGKTIEFNESRNPDSNSEGTPLPVIMEHGRIYITAVLQNNGVQSAPAKFLMDTGCNIGMVLAQGFFETNRTLTFTEIGEGQVEAIGGKFKVSLLECSGVSLGDVVMNSPFTETMGEGSRPFTETAGLLGNQIWRHFDVTIDYPGGKMFLKENSHYDGSYNYVHAGPD